MLSTPDRARDAMQSHGARTDITVRMTLNQVLLRIRMPGALERILVNGIPCQSMGSPGFAPVLRIWWDFFYPLFCSSGKQGENPS